MQPEVHNRLWDVSSNVLGPVAGALKARNFDAPLTLACALVDRSSHVVSAAKQ